LPAHVKAWVDHLAGWVTLRFPYDPETIALLKELPGSRWDAEEKCWRISTHGWEVLRERVKHTVQECVEPRAALPPSIADRLRPYQVDAANFLISRGGALNTSEQRTGKSATLIAAASALFGAGLADRVVLLYPNAAVDVWQEELDKWLGPTHLHRLPKELVPAAPWVFVGCHYEVLGGQEAELAGLFRDHKVIVIADELQLCKNRKSHRTEVLLKLARMPEVVARWGSTGTPMRNRNRDLWALFDFIIPRSMGGYWHYAKKFCGAVEGPHGWEDDKNTESKELAKRLASVSFRVTRAQVAPWLPKVEYKVIQCSAPLKLLAKYKRLESALALKVRNAAHGAEDSGSVSALKQLTRVTSEAKRSVAMERVFEYVTDGKKCIVFAHFHESLQDIAALLADSAQWPDGVKQPPIFCAGGWFTREQRMEDIRSWKASPEPAVLLANTMSTQVALDLSDAEGAIFLEIEYVPADLAQVKDRLVDVHLGKRKSPPIIELLVVKGTIDEDMAGILIPKMRAIDEVVGATKDGSELGRVLASSDLVDSTRLGLPNTDKETVQAALAGLAARWVNETDVSDQGDTTGLAEDFKESWDEPSRSAEDTNAEG